MKTSIAFWALYFAYEWFGLAALSGDYQSYFINACVAFPLAFVCSVFTVNVLLQKYYQQWARGFFWVIQIASTILLLLIKRFINYYIIYPNFFPHALGLPFFSVGKLIVELVNLYLIIALYSLFYFVKRSDAHQQEMKEMLQAKTIAELDLLKTQIQPHFLFNTLNNIYSSAVQTSPETARQISDLSSFLSYNLYDARLDFVPLDAELMYIRSYLGIQQNRYGGKLDTAVSIYNDLTGIKIAPMLLLPLIENCFKHGVADSLNGAWIRMDISTKESCFSIKVENSVERDLKERLEPTGGLGLTNVRRRLELTYPNRHDFRTFQGPESYLVTLNITTP